MNQFNIAVTENQKNLLSHKVDLRDIKDCLTDRVVAFERDTLASF